MSWSYSFLPALSGQVFFARRAVTGTVKCPSIDSRAPTLGRKCKNLLWTLRRLPIKSTQRSCITLRCFALSESSKFSLPCKAPLISKVETRIRSMRSGIFDTFQSPNILILWFIDLQLLFFQSGRIMWFDWLGRKIFSFNVWSNLSWRYLPPTCPKFSKLLIHVRNMKYVN